MKNLTDLPETNDQEIREKIHCYFSERNRIIKFTQLLAVRIKEIDSLVQQFDRQECSANPSEEQNTASKIKFGLRLK